MQVEDLSKEQLGQLLAQLEDDVMEGNSIGHASLVQITCEDFGVEPIDWNEALCLLQDNDYSVEECPQCGWVSEGNFYQSEDCDEDVCERCGD